MLRTSPYERRRAARDPLRGGVSLALLFWLGAAALFVLPLLRRRDDIGPTAGDFGRDEADVPYDEDVANYEKDHGPGLGAVLSQASEQYFGIESPWLRDTGAIDFYRIPSGKLNFEIHCVGCHGANGDGGGPAARYLDPRPRNFRKGLFKFSSTESAARPQRADLFQTITRGLAGSSMPEFRLVNEEKRLDLVEYVRWLAMKGEFENLCLNDAYEDEELPSADGLRDNAELVIRRWLPSNLRTVFPGSAETERGQASIDRGRALFTDPTKGSCFSCHGREGRGDGPAAGDFKDDWGYPIRPRDLTAGTFRAGAQGSDLYRTIAVGIKGTPMASFAGALKPDEIWDLVHFVQSLSTQPAAR
jgi:mono/diheme cytochrome c family protein